jgi:hypothetical protein
MEHHQKERPHEDGTVEFFGLPYECCDGLFFQKSVISLLKHYEGSHIRALRSLYPELNLKAEKILKPLGLINFPYIIIAAHLPVFFSSQIFRF